MKTLFLILFFSKTILLTPTPVDLTNNWLEITPQESFSAITGGASILIQVPIEDSRIKTINRDGDIFNQLDRIFPPETYEAILTDSKGNIILLSERHFSISDFSFTREDSLHISLSAKSPMPTKVEFISVKIKSISVINNVKIYWKNYSM